MTLHIHEGETQRAFVERTLRADGSISAHEAMYDLRDGSDRPRGITRLAAIVETLRSADWEIDTHVRPGEQAVYTLRHQSEPPWRRGWRCSACRSLPATEPTVLLGDMGQAHCPTCGTRTMFRRVAA